MAVQKRLVQVGYSKQTGKGVAAAQPTFYTGVTAGKPANWTIDESVIEATSNAPVFGEVDRKLVVPGMDFTSLVHPKMIGMLLYAALGSITTTGAGAPYQHVIVPANDVPYLTAFGRTFGGDYLTVVDNKIDTLEIAWDGAGKITVAVTMMGLTLDWEAVAFVPVNDESVGGTPLFRAAGGTFKFDAASGVPVVANITKGTLKISNNIEAVPQGNSVQPGDVIPGVKAIDLDLTIVPNDMTDLRKALTGTAGGHSISNVPIYGSFDWFYSIDANTDLRLAATRVQAKPEMPAADPKGGALQVAFKGAVLQPPSGDALTATVHNAVASY